MDADAISAAASASTGAPTVEHRSAARAAAQKHNRRTAMQPTDWTRATLPECREWCEKHGWNVSALRGLQVLVMWRKAGDDSIEIEHTGTEAGALIAYRMACAAAEVRLRMEKRNSWKGRTE